ncbi:MAG TPA: carboxypeptidase-like regulatory domain-containing protein [Candidatus Deferrimicrobium sp.]|nr:carboxypeptidase-like regulatory domain-containing protein [Candidatus Deferrimicrobium sp.]
MNKKITTVSVVLLITFFLLAIPIEVYAQNTNLGVTILQLTPKTGTGIVGSQVNLQGTIYQSNGTYQVIFGKVVVDSGVAQGYYVNSNFTVPELPSGTYSLILRDESVNVNTSQSFSISTAYLITPSSASLQEGDSVSLTVSVTGGQTGTSYSAAVSVVLPSPLGSNYVRTVSLGIPNDKGTASAAVTFPDSSFSPSGSLTDYAGTYTAYFNQSESLAQGNFAVNFIDKTTYHRGDTISVRATGYQPNTAATLTITSVSSGSTLDTASVTSSADGIISATRVVSSNFDVGDYIVRISAQSTAKAVQDAENFTVVGYAIKIETTNLAGQIVPSVSLQAKDSTTGTVTNALSDSNGIANFKLEKGTSVITAVWNGVSVGETSITVSGDGTFTVSCELINLKITVKNTAGIIMPYVDLKITYQYQSSSGTKTGDSIGQTDVSGSYTLISTLPTASYTIDASVYGKIFNAGNNTVTNLPTQATAQVFIIAPVETLTLNVVGFNQEAISGARIELVELSNGLFYSATTDSNGIASTKATFGMYRARIYQENVLINETNVEVFDNSQQQIHCTLFGIQLTVTVVDFFGTPISNVNVTLNGPTIISAQTQGNGKATFNDIIGGNMQIIAQAKGIQDAYQAVTLTVNQPAELQIKIDKYIAVGSMLIQASLLITILIILAGLISLILVEVYLRRRSKHAAVGTN